MSEKKIGFIGAGNMATAIINGILTNKAKAAEDISVFDPDASKCEAMAKKGVGCAQSGAELVGKSDIVVLAVKPQNYDEVLSAVSAAASETTIFVTIAAGISIEYVRKGLGKNCPMVRVMPNTPLLLGKGATAMCRSENISDEDFDEVYNMFALSGDVALLPEEQMNAIIAVNGSSPAYIYLFAKAMVDYAASVGIDGATALSLVCKTFEGSAEMLRSSGDTPEQLIEKVCSKGGTTIEAMNVLRDSKVPEAIIGAMAACTRRAEELGR